MRISHDSAVTPHPAAAPTRYRSQIDRHLSAVRLPTGQGHGQCPGLRCQPWTPKLVAVRQDKRREPTRTTVTSNSSQCTIGLFLAQFKKLQDYPGPAEGMNTRRPGTESEIVQIDQAVADRRATPTPTPGRFPPPVRRCPQHRQTVETRANRVFGFPAPKASPLATGDVILMSNSTQNA